MPKKSQAAISPGVGLKDVARACNLSVMTVSRALRNLENVTPATRERVQAKAREMGYVPNRLANLFGSQKSHVIGVVVPEIDHTIFPDIMKNIERAMSSEQYLLALCCSYDSVEREAKETQALLERRVDGIIMAPVSMTESLDAVQRIMAMGCPLVLFDRALPDVAVNTVTVDDYNGARQAVNHLIENGCKHIMHLAGPEDVWTSEERLRGYRDAMKAAGCSVQKNDVVRCGFTISDGEQAAQALLNRGKLPDALFCVNDPVAIGAFKVLRDHGVSIPDTLALVGFSNTLESEIMAVPLTTVNQDSAQIGARAAELLLERISGQKTQKLAENTVIEAPLVVRASSVKT